MTRSSISQDDEVERVDLSTMAFSICVGARSVWMKAQILPSTPNIQMPIARSSSRRRHIATG